MDTEISIQVKAFFSSTRGSGPSFSDELRASYVRIECWETVSMRSYGGRVETDVHEDDSLQGQAAVGGSDNDGAGCI